MKATARIWEGNEDRTIQGPGAEFGRWEYGDSDPASDATMDGWMAACVEFGALAQEMADAMGAILEMDRDGSAEIWAGDECIAIVMIEETE